jgi:hypothetical protein
VPPRAGSSLRELDRALARFQEDELSVEELRAQLEAVEGEDARELAAMLRAIELGICEAQRRPTALEQIEPIARSIRARR